MSILSGNFSRISNHCCDYFYATSNASGSIRCQSNKFPEFGFIFIFYPLII